MQQSDVTVECTATAEAANRARRTALKIPPLNNQAQRQRKITVTEVWRRSPKQSTYYHSLLHNGRKPQKCFTAWLATEVPQETGSASCRKSKNTCNLNLGRQTRAPSDDITVTETRLLLQTTPLCLHQHQSRFKSESELTNSKEIMWVTVSPRMVKIVTITN